MIALKDIARQAGVSIRAVTKVIKGEDGVSPAKRVEIQKIVRETGYRPNLLARSLKTKKTNNIGIIAANLDMEVTAKKLHYIAAQLAAKSMRTSIGLIYGANTKKQFQDFVGELSCFCDGLIIVSTNPENALPEIIRTIAVPFILADLNIPGAPSIAIDRKAGIISACETLQNYYRSFVYLTPDPPDKSERCRAFLETMQRLGRTHEILRTPMVGPEGGYRMGDALAARDSTLVLCYSDKTAIGLLKRLYERGADIPNKIGIVGLDDDLYAAYTHKALSTIQQPVKELAALCVDALMDRLAGKAVLSKVIPTRFIARETTRSK